MNTHSTSCCACNRPVMVRYMYQETGRPRPPPRKKLNNRSAPRREGQVSSHKSGGAGRRNQTDGFQQGTRQRLTAVSGLTGRKRDAATAGADHEKRLPPHPHVQRRSLERPAKGNSLTRTRRHLAADRATDRKHFPVSPPVEDQTEPTVGRHLPNAAAG